MHSAFCFIFVGLIQWQLRRRMLLSRQHNDVRVLHGGCPVARIVFFDKGALCRIHRFTCSCFICVFSGGTTSGGCLYFTPDPNYCVPCVRKSVNIIHNHMI